MANFLDRIANPENTFEQIMQEISQLGTELIDLDQYCELVLKRISARYSVQSAGIFLKQRAAGRYHLSARINLAISDMQISLKHPLPVYLDQNPRPLYASDIDYLPQFEALWEKEREDLKRLDAFLFLPLKAGKDLVAILALGPKANRGTFNSEEKELITLASQVAMAIRVKYLITSELRLQEEAGSMRQALAEISSGWSSEEGLNRILLHLRADFPYESGCIFVVRNERLIVAAVQGFNNHEAVVGHDYPLGGNTPFVTIQETRDLLLVENTRDDPLFKGYAGPPVRLCWMGVPLIYSGELTGVLTLSSQKNDAFRANPARIELVNTLATQAAITIENTRLFKVEQQQRQMGDALQLIGKEVSQIPDFEQVLDFLLERASQVFPADISMLFRMEGGRFQLARYRYSPKLAGQVDLAAKSPAFEAAAFANLHYLVNAEKPRIIPDTRNELEWIKNPVEVRSWAGTPIFLDGKAVACFTFSSLKPDYFQPGTAELLTILAGQVAMAFQNAHLVSEMRELAIIDEATGLFNSRHFLDLSEREYRRGRRFRRPLSLMMVSIDQLEQIRKDRGADISSQVVRYVGELIQTNLRNVDIFGHLDGDDLGIMLTETDRSGAAILSDRLLSIVTNSAVITTAGLIKITLSAGVAVMPADAASLQAVLDMAASALKTAQRNGHNRIVFYQKEVK